MFRKKKKGMSEVIMALLFVLLILSTIAAVVLWNKKVFSILTSGSKTCSEISFTIGDFCYELQGTTSAILRFNVRNELEEKTIEGFSVFGDDKYGNIQSISNLITEKVLGFESKSFVTNPFTNIDTLSEIRIVPHLEVDGKNILCENKKILIKWSTIKLC